MFESLMDNYQRVEDLAKAGENSFGQLAEANQKRVESLEGQINILKDKMLAFTDSLQPLIFGSVELSNNVLDVVNAIGAIPTVVGIASASFLSFSDSGQKVKNTLMEMVGSKIQLVDGFNQIISAQNQRVESAKNEVAIAQQQISSTIETIAKLRLEHSARNDNTEAIAKQQQALVGLNKGLVNSQKQLAIATLKASALQSVLSLGLGAAIGVAITLISKLGKEMIDLNKSYSVEGIAESVNEMKTKFEEASTALDNYRKAKSDLSTMKSLVDSINNENLSASEQEEKIATINELLSQHASSYQSIEGILNNENISYERRIELLEREAELQKQITGQAAYNSFMKDGTFFGLGLGDNTFEKTIKQLDQLANKTNDAKSHLDHAIEGLENGTVTEAGYNSVKNSFDTILNQAETDVALLATSLAQQMNFAMQSLSSGHMTQAEYDKIAESYKAIIKEVNKALQDAGIEGFSMYDLLEEKVDDVADSVDNLNKSIKETSEVADMKDLNKSYVEALEGLDDAQELLDSFKEGLTTSELRSIFDSDLMADYNGALTDSVAIQEHLNSKIAEMQEIASNAYFDMNRESSEFWSTQIKNSQAWIDYEKQTQDELTQYLADAFGIQLGDFQAFIDSKGGLRDVDLSNAKNLAEAEKILNGDLNSQILGFFSSFIDGKADARIDDMDNVVAFLKAQNTEEVKTIQQLAKLWNDYYNAKKAEINATISTLKKVDVTASKVSNQIKEDGNKALADAGLQMPGIKDHYESMYGQANQLKEDVQKATDELKQLEAENNKFQDVLNNLNGYNATNTLKQNYTDANKGNFTGSSGSGSSSSDKGSSSSSKEVADLDLKIDRYYDLQDAIDDVNNALDKNQALQERATGVEKAKLMKEEIKLYQDLQKATQDLVKEQQKERDELKKTISSYGGTFDSNGDIKNRKKWLEGLQAQVNKLSGESKEAKKEEIETLMSIIERYEELHNDTIPSTQLEYENLTNTIKDLQKEQLEYITDLQKDITSAIESELKKRTEAIKTELEKQKELYNSQYDEENWERELASEQRKLDEIQQQIDNAMRDTSLAGQLYLQQLREEYAEQEKAINEMIRDKEHELGENRFDEEIEKIEKEEEAMLDPENIADLVNKAIANGFVSIGNETIQLNQLMSDWLDDTGDGLYAVGNLLKSEMIDNLKTVKSLMQDVGLVSLSGGVAVSSASYVPTANTRAIDNAISNNTNNNSNVSIGSLLTVQGNVTEDVMPQLQSMISQSEKQITNSIMKALTFS